MVLEIVLIAVSLVILYIGADFLVKGSSSLAVRLGITPLVVGLTVVAFGTSAPELLVSVRAALSKSEGIALGNVIGSNIFNVSVILALTAIIYPLKVNKQLIRKDMPVLIASTIILCVFLLLGVLPRWLGIIFVISMSAYTFYSVTQAKKGKAIEQEERIKLNKNVYTDLSLMIIGLGGLVWGSNLLVHNATVVAHSIGWNDAVIGLTIVAAGTSMPELATSLMAAAKKRTDIAVGNVIGSNIFNILTVLGITSSISPIAANQISMPDICVLIFTTLLLLPFMRSNFTVSRPEGFLLFAIYVAYTITLIVKAV